MAVAKPEGCFIEGMTDAQFKGFLRFVLQDVQDAIAEQDPEKVKELLAKLEDKLQKTLED